MASKSRIIFEASISGFEIEVASFYDAFTDEWKVQTKELPKMTLVDKWEVQEFIRVLTLAAEESFGDISEKAEKPEEVVQDELIKTEIIE